MTAGVSIWVTARRPALTGFGAACLAVALALALAVIPAGNAAAQGAVKSANLPGVGSEPARAQMAPVPDPSRDAPREGPLNVHVFGDSLGDGMWAGLYRLLPKAEGYRVTKHSKVSTGLVRKDYFDWSKKVREVVARHQVDVAVVMIGTNDRQPIVEGGRHALRSPEWERIYTARIDDMIEVLKAEGADIYWVELPAMRSARFGGDMQYFNSLYRDRARAHGIAFVPTWQRTLDDTGVYSAYGTDDTGRTRLMRTNDGIHFTMRGYIQLASFVTEAMEDGAVPDAGPETAPAPGIVSPAAPPATPPGAQPAAPLPDTGDVPAPLPRPGDAAASEAGPERSEREGIVSSIASAISDLRGFVLPEPKPGRADDLRLERQ